MDEKTSVETKTEQGDSELYSWIQCLVAALIFCVLLFSFFVRLVGVIGSSMLPNYENADRVVVSNLFYTPEQGDVVIVQKLSYDTIDIIKRVIATEGQTMDIDFENHIVYVDGEALSEPYIYEPTARALDFSGPVTVPEGCVFVMGDNRNDSLDSRYSLIGFVDRREIVGHVLYRLFPFGKIGSIV